MRRRVIILPPWTLASFWPHVRLHRLAAINDHGVPDDEGGGVGAQPHGAGGDLFRGSGAAHSSATTFMHRKTPRRSMSTIRSHASSVRSAAGVSGCSTPALLKAKSRRPNVSAVLSSAALTSSARETSHLTASARLPAFSTRRAVS